jgi:hypothetical protein
MILKLSISSSGQKQRAIVAHPVYVVLHLMINLRVPLPRGFSR